jgi:hypothetical protein
LKETARDDDQENDEFDGQLTRCKRREPVTFEKIYELVRQ